ncbi:type II toxin-antitoxin system RelB/DinJ family antitoxin [Enterococcus timonensis]|uniref:type II toxin-antitoxin system RelB/DinJ family antitoxin n=1 Tax=Enterococcus timonensis TaxID=1852364 RepID=UPI0008DB29E7|nr:type II toxin-antitoxin system RelB/DinJ family antitoxin [Enterococcus timonensis]
MKTKDKKRVQVQIDEELFNEAESVFNALGLNATSAITVFYKRVVANGGIPFDLELTEHEQAKVALMNATKNSPKQVLSTNDELMEWLDEDE